jgi:1,4-dihydroxy-2-naphthoyl-CoA hydrolase
MDESWQALLPEGWAPAVPLDRCFDAQYGLEVVSHDVAGDGVVRGRVQVSERLLNHLGAVHGGVFASAAEALASRGTALAVLPQMAMGLSNDTNVLRAPSGGVIDIEARVRARDDGLWTWTVDARDGDGGLCAYSRVTVAVRD